MKQFLIALLSITTVFAQAQTETLFGNINHIGGFGGPMIEISQINGETVADVGGGGALILNNFFVGGYGLGTDAPNISVSQETFDIDFDHGGLWLGYTSNPRKLAHIYSSVKVGWGDVTLRDGDGDKRYSDNVLVIAPEAGVELNITNWFRLGFTGGYRFTDGVNELPAAFDLSDDKFSGGFGKITFRFGGFGDYSSGSGVNDDDFDLKFNFDN